jgi:hypothetical protein
MPEIGPTSDSASTLDSSECRLDRFPFLCCVRLPFRLQIAVVEFQAEGATDSLNFAEAALLIQGSTCVYSKKVSTPGKRVVLCLLLVDSVYIALPPWTSFR